MKILIEKSLGKFYARWIEHFKPECLDLCGEGKDPAESLKDLERKTMAKMIVDNVSKSSRKNLP